MRTISDVRLYLLSFLTSCFLVSDNFYRVSPGVHRVFINTLPRPVSVLLLWDGLLVFISIEGFALPKSVLAKRLIGLLPEALMLQTCLCCASARVSPCAIVAWVLEWSVKKTESVHTLSFHVLCQ